MSEAESQWIAAAKLGDAQAFRRLVEAHARALYPVCFRILGDAALAEDAVQETFISAWRGLDRFDGRASFGTWLHRIAVNAALMLLRSRRDAASLDDTPEEVLSIAPGTVPSLDPLAVAHGQDIGRKLGTAMSGLSPFERAAFVLRHLEQYPLEEIASSLGTNINAIKQAVFRAVQKLRRALEPLRSEA